MICVSNFPSAMLDLPIESSQATSDLEFEAFTEHIPPVGTKVRLVLAPRLEKGESKARKATRGKRKEVARPRPPLARQSAEEAAAD